MLSYPVLGDLPKQKLAIINLNNLNKNLSYKFYNLGSTFLKGVFTFMNIINQIPHTQITLRIKLHLFNKQL